MALAKYRIVCVRALLEGIDGGVKDAVLIRHRNVPFSRGKAGDEKRNIGHGLLGVLVPLHKANVRAHNLVVCRIFGLREVYGLPVFLNLERCRPEPSLAVQEVSRRSGGLSNGVGPIRKRVCTGICSAVLICGQRERNLVWVYRGIADKNRMRGVIGHRERGPCKCCGAKWNVAQCLPVDLANTNAATDYLIIDGALC